MKKLKYNITLDIAKAKHRFSGSWRNTRATWQDIAASLEETVRTKETLAAYMKLPKDKQDDIKDVGGFVGGYLKNGKRRKDCIVHRQLVALDVDHAANLDTWLDCRDMDFAACMYSTHKHSRNKPRYRILFPLDRKVSPDEYEAIARVVADWMGIDIFDDTTYQPNRLMYYPSTSVDGEYLYDIIEAPILSADEVLDQLPDWEDPTTWPRSSRELEKLDGHISNGKAEDPEEKEGIVGAFCRSYGIEEAIAEFLPEVYTPCKRMGADRYTFTGGSTSGGLMIYDNKQAYSHHASDPAGQRLCNAFDLVRLHKFGDLDEGKQIKDILRAPSFKAMAEFASGIKEVKKEILRERREASRDEYEDEDFTKLESKAREAADADDWLEELETERNGKTVKNTIANVVLILNNDPRLVGCFGYNEFEQRETAIKRLPWDIKGKFKYPRPLSDSDDAEVRLYLEQVYGITGRGQMQDGLTVVLRGNSYHPVRNYLDALKWDGVERLDTLYIDLFGADDTEYMRAITRKAHVAAVARIYDAGCKFDQVTVLVGDQGVGKSTSIARMGGKWFSDSVTTLTGKEALEAIQGSWLIELGELSSLKKAEVDVVKHFVAKTEDRFRVAYGKRVEHFPRRCVFFGTTNEEDFLRDATGNRRFWVVNILGRTGLVDVWDYLDKETVGQLWAEAKERYEAGEPLYLDSRLEAVARGVQENHLEKDDRLGLVLEYLSRKLPNDWHKMDTFMRRNWLADADAVGQEERERVCLIEIWAECLGNDPAKITRAESFWLGRLMKSCKEWQPHGGTLKFDIYGVQKAYTRTENTYRLRKPK